MSKKDSSLTRVKPIFDLIGNDVEKLNKFFNLFSIQSPQINHKSLLPPIRYGSNEKLLPPSRSLLIWMLNNLEKLSTVNDFGVKKNSDTYLKREKLFSGDKDTLRDALIRCSTNKTVQKSEWYIFEGFTHPDIFIETDDSIYIGEAKRTEKDITTKTKWLNPRDQFIRHIDSLLDQPKKIYSFYLLEKNEYLKGIYPQRMELYKSFDYYKLNLKHRDLLSINRAMESFIGFVFWEDIAECFNLKFPDTINDINQ